MKPGRPPNVFLYYHDEVREDAAFENLLTEVTGFFLSCDRDALASFCAMLLGDGSEEAVGIETQARQTLGTPDMLVRFRSGRHLIIENKTESPLGPQQLENYLKELETSGGYLTLISKRPQHVGECVLKNVHYKQPSARLHFTWRDIYAWVHALSGANESPMRQYFKEYLETCGFAPSHLPGEWPRLFADRTDEGKQKIQVEFGDVVLSAVEALFKANDFRLSRVAHKGWQATPRTEGQHRYRHLVILPLPSRAAFLRDERRKFVSEEVFAVGLVYDRAEDAEAMYATAPQLYAEENRTWVALPPHAINPGRWRLEFATALRPFLTDADNIQNRFRESLTAILREIWRVEHVQIGVEPN
jgi:hypothetical protein